MIIDKNTVKDWVTFCNGRNAQYATELDEARLLEVASVAAEMTRNFLHGLRSLADDEASATHMIENASFGILHAVSQVLLFTTPPTFDTPKETVN